jgi:hypothetical protein
VTDATMGLAHAEGADSRITPEGIYGCLAVAVVCIAWEGANLGELAFEIAIYAVSLWLFHIYARVVHGAWSRSRGSAVLYWARREWPHLEAALPALLVVLAGWASAWNPLRTSDWALWVTLANLLAWQLALLLPGRPSWRAVGLTLLMNVMVLPALLWLRLAVK